MRIYVGNLAHEVTDTELSEAFAAHGTVASAKVIVDRDSGQSRGFGFVEIEDKAAAEAAIGAL
ncbi:MAG: RNA-binding protein, partial [Dehalococcoidia bacterium]